MGVQVALLYPGAHSFGYIPRSGITGSYGSSIFSLLRDFHVAFYSGCTNLHSHQQDRSVPFPPHSQQLFLLFVLLMVAIMTGVRWKSMSFWLAFPSWSRCWAFLHMLLSILYFFEKCLLSSFAHLFSVLLIFWEVNFLMSLHILVMIPCQMYSW
jgi:hypothetical protein